MYGFWESHGRVGLSLRAMSRITWRVLLLTPSAPMTIEPSKVLPSAQVTVTPSSVVVISVSVLFVRTLSLAVAGSPLYMVSINSVRWKVTGAWP